MIDPHLYLSCRYTINPQLCTSFDNILNVHVHYFSPGKKAPRKSTTGQELPSARAISRQVTEDSDDLIANGYAALMVHFGQLLIHDTDQVPVESGE